jgi:uncharacterized protein with FMN-binding domain
MSKSQSNKLMASLALLVLIVVIVGVAIASKPKTATSVNTTSNSVASSSNSNQPATASKTGGSSDYKDGTYMATGSYDSPGGTEKISVSLTLNKDVVSNVNAQSGANDPTAASYQSIFLSNYKKYVVGKKINAIKISNVSGSSLTSKGFEDALKQIEKQAEA